MEPTQIWINGYLCDDGTLGIIVGDHTLSRIKKIEMWEFGKSDFTFWKKVSNDELHENSPL